MQFRLRTLLIATALGPPVLWAVWQAPPIVGLFAAALAYAFVLFLCALGTTILIRRLVDLWDP